MTSGIGSRIFCRAARAMSGARRPIIDCGGRFERPSHVRRWRPDWLGRGDSNLRIRNLCPAGLCCRAVGRVADRARAACIPALGTGAGRPTRWEGGAGLIQHRRAEEMTIDELATCHQRTAAGSRHDRLTNAGRAATTAAPLTLEIGELKALPSLLRRILGSPPSDCLAYCRFGSRN
jgi:hypothetical protein